MNDKASATAAIKAFLEGPERFLLVDGTHQNEKHRLVLNCIGNYYNGGTILFRANAMENVNDFFGSRSARFPMKWGDGQTIAADSMNATSWKRSPRQIDIGMMYPLGSWKLDEGADSIKDLMNRGAKKIVLVTWVDTKSFHWLDHLKPARATYDTDDADHNAKVLKVWNDAKRLEGQIDGLPDYAVSGSPERMAKIRCDTCRAKTWTELNKPNPGLVFLRDAEDSEYKATCLKCGSVLTDNYKW